MMVREDGRPGVGGSIDRFGEALEVGYGDTLLVRRLQNV